MGPAPTRNKASAILETETAAMGQTPLQPLFVSAIGQTGAGLFQRLALVVAPFLPGCIIIAGGGGQPGNTHGQDTQA